MAIFKELADLRSKWEDHELTQDECDKLRGDCHPGCRVRIYWETGYGDKYHDDGYVFTVDGMDADIGDCFVHVPRPENPGGKGAADPEWTYMVMLQANPYCTKIVCKS